MSAPRGGHELPWLPALGVLLLLGSNLVVLLVVGMAVAVGPFYIPTGIRYQVSMA
jgi:hypothetical protein